MKVTFPHMGNIYIPLKALFDDLGVETVIPPKCSKKTLELGIKYAPEWICLPFKINLGNYLESIEKGADTIIMAGGCGPCRLGYYAEVQKQILKDLGIDVEIVVLEAPDADFRAFYSKISRLIQTKNIFKIIKYFKNAIYILRKLNTIEEIILKTRPHEMIKNDIDHFYQHLLFTLENSKGSKQMITHIHQAFQQIIQIPLNKNDNDVLKVGIVGEIYTVIENFSNLDIGKKLNDMGVEVYKSITPGEWLIENLFYRVLGRSKEIGVRKAAAPYVKTFVGGHGRETVGNTVLYAEKNFDGVIHLMPFSCMPEIVAMSILPKVQKEKNIPVLSLTIDEMTGEAGYLTRLEAYIDLLRNRKRHVFHENESTGFSRNVL